MKTEAFTWFYSMICAVLFTAVLGGWLGFIVGAAMATAGLVVVLWVHYGVYYARRNTYHDE